MVSDRTRTWETKILVNSTCRETENMGSALRCFKILEDERTGGRRESTRRVGRVQELASCTDLLVFSGQVIECRISGTATYCCHPPPRASDSSPPPSIHSMIVTVTSCCSPPPSDLCGCAAFLLCLPLTPASCLTWTLGSLCIPSLSAGRRTRSKTSCSSGIGRRWQMHPQPAYRPGAPWKRTQHRE